MSKFAEKVALYTAEMKKLGIDVDPELLHICVKACGPAIYNTDAETVSSSDKSELERVKKNFLKGKLGLKESEESLDKLIQQVVDIFGSTNRNKYRAIFYYLLSQKTGQTPG